ncbi:MAG: glycosyltransferase [Bacteroidota bacterium]
MNPLPVVSIGVPLYNAENFVEQALDSLIGQTWTDLEIIISDNASTDRTEEICRRYAASDQRIRYYRNDVNVGAGRNYNRVFELSRGKFFKWAAHDDVCAPEFVERCLKVLEERPDVVLAFPRMVDIDEKGTPIEGKPISDMPRGERGSSPVAHTRFRYLVRLGYTCEEVFGVIRSDVLRKTRLIQSYTDSDRTLLAELSLHGRLEEIPEQLFYHRVHKGMSTQAFTDWQSRTAWFDPTKAGKVVFPLWRQYREYLAAIVRSPAALKDKLYCFLYMANWLRRHNGHLRIEIQKGFQLMMHRGALS